MAVVTADEVQGILRTDERYGKPGARSYLPPTLSVIKALQATDPLFVCNVGPWSYQIERPSVSLAVPACPEGKKYAKSAPFPRIHRFAKIISEDEMGWCEDDGLWVLRDCIGMGHGSPHSQSIARFGVFVTEEGEPTAKELAGAMALYNEYLDMLIAEARDAYEAGPKERATVITRFSRHLDAARIKGIDEPWVNHQVSETAVRCEMCGTRNPAGVAKCSGPNCEMILDMDLYKRIMAKQNAMLDKMTAPGKN